MVWTWDFFISFPSEQEGVAGELASLLRAKSANVFLSSSMTAGASWQSSVLAALKSAAVVVPILSPETNGASYQISELTHAVQLVDAKSGVRIAPIYTTYPLDIDVLGLNTLHHWSLGRGVPLTEIANLLLDEIALDQDFLRFRRLLEECDHQSRLEVDTNVGRKFLPELYQSRSAEHLLVDTLRTDGELAQRLQSLRRQFGTELSKRLHRLDLVAARDEGTLSLLSENIDKLERAVQEAAPDQRSHKRAELEEKRTERRAARALSTRRSQERQAFSLAVERIDAVLTEVLRDGRPTDPEQQGLFAEAATHTTTLIGSLGELDELLAFRELCEQTSRPNVVFIDRAGGGKTNLLCSYVRRHAQTSPCLFVACRVPIDSDDSLSHHVLTKLGWRGNEIPEDFVSALSDTLKKQRATLTVFLDGINETPDIPRFNRALTATVRLFSSVRVRFVATCRDVFWTFFEAAPWASTVGATFHGRLAAFSDDEYNRASEAYLAPYRIRALLGDQARLHCRHPLLLRFFCEAYGDPHGPETDLGEVPDIRLKPLFDDYWKKKLVDIGGSPSPEQVVLRLAKAMFESNATSIEAKNLRRAAGVSHELSPDSTYTKLLGEDVILEQRNAEIARTGQSERIGFVYDEFMEYALARWYLQSGDSVAFPDADAAFRRLSKKESAFRSIVGVVEYVIAFLLDERRFRSAFRLLVLMSKAGKRWDQLVGNVFAKCDGALSMLTDLTSVPELADAATLRAILDALARAAVAGHISAQIPRDACIALGLRVILPETFSLSSTEDWSRPDTRDLEKRLDEAFRTRHQPLLVSRYKLGREILRVVSKTFVALITAPRSEHAGRTDDIRVNLWRDWSGPREFSQDPRGEHRALLFSAFVQAIASSSRRELLLAYVANGLFDVAPRVARETRHAIRAGKHPFCVAARRRDPQKDFL